MAAVAVALGAAGTRYMVLAGSSTAVPAWIAGPLADASWRMPAPALCALLATMVLAYLGVVRFGATIPARWALGTIVTLHLIFLLAPPLFSSDVFNYLDAGRLDALYGLNPYLATPLARSGDIAFPFTGMAWMGAPSVYGPGFTVLCAALAPLGVAAQLWALKALAGAASLACTGLVWACARRLGRPPVPAALFFGCNPIVLVATVGGAHNDLLVCALVLAGVWLAAGTRSRRAATALVGAAAIKLTGALVLPFLLIGSGRRWRATARAAAGAAAMVALGTLALFGTAPGHVLAALGAGADRHVGELRSVPGFLAGYAGIGPVGPLARSLLAGVGLAGVASAALLAARGRLPWLTAAGWGVLAVLLTSTRLEPWYAVWLIPLAALGTDRRLRGASHALLIAIALIAFARYALRLGIHYPHGG